MWFSSWSRLPASMTLTSRPGTAGVIDVRFVWKLVALTPDTLWAEAGAAATASQTTAAEAQSRIRRMAVNRRAPGRGPCDRLARWPADPVPWVGQTSERRMRNTVRASAADGPAGESPSTRKQAWIRAARSVGSKVGGGPLGHRRRA